MFFETSSHLLYTPKSWQAHPMLGPQKSQSPWVTDFRLVSREHQEENSSISQSVIQQAVSEQIKFLTA